MGRFGKSPGLGSGLALTGNKGGGGGGGGGGPGHSDGDQLPDGSRPPGSAAEWAQRELERMFGQARRGQVAASKACCEPQMDRNVPASVVTPRALGARQWEAFEPIEDLILGDQTNDEGWQQIKIDRPSLFKSLSVTSGNFLYAPYKRPINEAVCYRSIQPGWIYMGHPGIWWWKYSPTSQTAGPIKLNARLIRFDCSDPMTAIALMGVIGGHSAVETLLDGASVPNEVVVPALPGVYAGSILGPRRERCAIILQNTGAVPLRWTLGDYNPTATCGFILAAGAQLTFGPDIVPRKSLKFGGVGAAGLLFAEQYME